MISYRRIVKVFLTMALTTSLAGTVAAQEPWDFDSAMEGAATGQLKILLTNDDGYLATGINTLRDALAAAGYDVRMVAPMGNTSGFSAKVNTTDPLEFAMVEEDIFWVDGTPADCVFVGASLVFGVENLPDLIVSGTNISHPENGPTEADRTNGANLGQTLTFSGTAGAVFTGLSSGPIPGIAFSSDVPPGVTWEEHYSNVATFATRLVQVLERNSQTSGRPLLPVGTFLNVNYPPLMPEEVRGARFATQFLTPSQFVMYTVDPDNPTMVIPESVGLNVRPRWPTDQAKYDAGFITMTLMDTNYLAQDADLSGRNKRDLRNLVPTRP